MDDDVLFLARLRGLAMEYDRTFGQFPENRYEGWAFQDWVEMVLAGEPYTEGFDEELRVHHKMPEYWLKK